jgi:ribonuclease BN (tRNA processing enzyme)
MQQVTLEFLGCGDAFSSGGRFHTCFLVRGAARPVLIDCGASAATALEKARVNPAEIGVVIVSHLHGDHFGGLPFLLLDGAYNRPRTAPLVVAGPPGIEACVYEAVDLMYPGTREAVAAQVPARFVELEHGRGVRLDDVEVTAFQVVHSRSTTCFGLRVSIGGKVFAYSGDAQWSQALVDVSRGADLFVCECTGFDQPLYSHMSHTELCEHAAELGGVRLMLTHLGRDVLDHLDELRWPFAEDGLVVEL